MSEATEPVPALGRASRVVAWVVATFLSPMFLRFIVVGVVNTFNGVWLAWVYSLFLQANVAFVIGYLTSVTTSFFLNSWIVFRTHRSLRRYVKFVFSYIPNFTVQNVAVIVVYNILHFDKLIAYIAAAVVGVPITFLVLKFFAFRERPTTATTDA